MCTPYIESQKLVAMATSLRCSARYRQYLPFVSRPLELPSITNCLVAIVHTKPVNSNFSPKIGCYGNDPYTLDLGYVSAIG